VPGFFRCQPMASSAKRFRQDLAAIDDDRLAGDIGGLF
jgi:hypothetical protein